MPEKGRVAIHSLESKILKNNPLGDPHVRDLTVYLPPGYEETKTYPTLLAVVGFTGTGASLFNVDTLGENLQTRLDRLITSGKCEPLIVAAPDCFSRLGGNQYINSSAMGNYEDYLLEEILPFVNETYSTGNWGVFGKSSGGYGSIVLGMRHPEIFQALADHSGDANFELCYITDFSKALDAFKEAGGPAQWLDAFWADDNRRRKKYMSPLTVIGMAGTYSPNPKSPHVGIDFPFDLETGEFDWEVWKRWQKWDPVRMVDEYADNLKKLKLIYVDCGNKDEFTLHWGSRALVKKIRDKGLEVFYEEFDDGHMAISYRYDTSLPMLAKALKK